MISLETAKKLKDAGLKRKLEIGDKVYMEGRIITVFVFDNDYPDNSPDCLIPNLDQLLAEIEKRGWEIDLQFSNCLRWEIDLQFFNNGTGWFCEVAKTVQFRHNKPRPKLTINNKDGTKTEVEPLNTCPGWGDYGEKRMNKEFTADSPDEAAALALLWILEQEANV